MDDLRAILDYINKIQRTIEYNADLSLGNSKFVKKDKVDNLLCCVLAKLPDKFKKKMRVPGNKYRSVGAFKLLQDVITKKAWYMPSMYKVDISKAKQLIASINSYIAKDLEEIDQNK